MKVIKEWKDDQGKIKRDKLFTYPITQIPSPYFYAGGMLYRFFAKPDTTIFSVDSVPLIDAIINSLILNWENILSHNLTISIMDYRGKISFSSRAIPPFYMSVYVMDAIFYCLFFPTMGWKWTT